MDIIHLLPDSVANQIAAGEVIQRPASCLKELVENSLDAGATHISVIVRDAGRTLLQVIDDGCGMSETDARMAFERHATSKIREAADLFSLHTMGFRGEALASICAVAQVEVQTRQASDEVGTRIEIAGSDVLCQEPCQCPVGTNFKVKNLFYNVPARRKFLKTDQTELRNLLTEFYHIVLVYPKVQFTFVSNDEILMELPAGTEKQRIEAVFGKSNNKFTGGLVDIATDTELVSIRGFIGKPEAAGKSAQQYFFVNGRYMQHPYFKKAVMTAYAGTIVADYNPSYFIYFDIAPERIDVNIHPTKTEIKFADEQAIFQIIMAAVRESLGKFNLSPSLDFNREGEFEMPVSTHVGGPVDTGVPASSGPQVVFDPNYNPFRATNHVSSSYRPSSPSTHVDTSWRRLYDVAPTGVGGNAASDLGGELTMESPIVLEGVTPYQYNGRYIIVPAVAGLMIVNQHRAHTCVQYYKVLEQIRTAKAVRQQVLFPEIIDLDASDVTLVQSIMGELTAVGFELEQFTRSSYSMNAVPAILDNVNPAATLLNILHAVREQGHAATDNWQETIALSLAKASAIPYGKTMTEPEMTDLLQRLLALPSYRLTPDGKRVMSLLTDDEISKRF